MGKTSWQVKARYNDKVYSRIQVQLDKDLVAKFKDKCDRYEISYSSVIKDAIEKFIREE